MSGRVVVVGAGIAGLTAGFRLRQRGYDVTVMEAEGRVGGRMASIERDGYFMDLGAVALSRKYAAMMDLIRDVGIEDRIVSVPDTLAIPKDGKICRIRTASPLRSANSGLLSVRSVPGAIRVALDGLRLGKVIDWDDLGAAEGFDRETVTEWLRRRGNPEIYHAIDALVRGGLMVDCDRLSAIVVQFLIASYFGAGLFTFRDGVGELPRALAERLDVRLQTRVTGVEETAGGVMISYEADGNGETTLEADACVVALNGHQMCAIHPQLPAHLRAVVRAVHYTRLMPITLALTERPEEQAYWLGLAKVDHSDLCAVFFDHNRGPCRAPAGAGLVTVFWHDDWNRREWETDDETIIERSVAEASRFVPGLDGAVKFASVHRWEASFPCPPPGTYRALHAVAESRAHAKRIHLAGDYFGGPSTNAAMSSGELAAKYVARGLASRVSANVAALR